MKKKKYLSWLWPFTKDARAQLLTISFFSVLMSAGVFINIRATINLVDVTLGGMDGSIIPPLILIGIGVSLICISIFARNVIRAIAGTKMQTNMREYIIRALYKIRYKDSQKKHSAELMTLATEDGDTSTFFFEFMSEAFIWTLVMVIGSITMMFMISWQMAIVVGISLVLAYVVMNGFAPAIQRRSSELIQAEQNVRKNMQEVFSNMLLFKVYSMVESLVDKNNNLQTENKNKLVKKAKINSYHHQVNNIYNELLTFTVYAVGGYFIASGTLTVGEVLAVLALRSNLYQPVLSFNQYIAVFSRTKASVNRIREVTELPPAEVFADVKIEEAKRLEVNNLSFSYNDEGTETEKVLRNISLKFETGKIIGIAGESGSGKSTLVKLIMGLYTPQSGSVKLMGTNGFYTQNILPFVSYVPPTDYVFNGSITDNIRMDNEIIQSNIENAAATAGIHEFIKTLPDGYSTVIGEGATEVSSGQGQRLAIARAFYQNSPIAILDEPTSNLDKDSIATLHNEIKKLSKNKIFIIISHDKSTLDLCDEVYHIENGKIKSIQNNLKT